MLLEVLGVSVSVMENISTNSDTDPIFSKSRRLDIGRKGFSLLNKNKLLGSLWLKRKVDLGLGLVLLDVF
jgi:hypothetical protein